MPHEHQVLLQSFLVHKQTTDTFSLSMQRQAVTHKTLQYTHPSCCTGYVIICNMGMPPEGRYLKGGGNISTSI